VDDTTGLLTACLEVLYVVDGDAAAHSKRVEQVAELPLSGRELALVDDDARRDGGEVDRLCRGLSRDEEAPIDGEDPSGRGLDEEARPVDAAFLRHEDIASPV